jgi:6-pyruvoyltetrahydropterin/6-carboxytetrahydropterin synthase
MKFQSTKLVEGFSTCFRQPKANSHCKFLHGYALKFKIVFQGDLDDCNWVIDFGFMKKGKTKILENDCLFSVKEWFDYMFDHTVIVTSTDPFLNYFIELEGKEVIRLRILEGGAIGCETFAKIVFEKLNKFLKEEYKERDVKVYSVECIENEKNSALCLCN